MSRADSLELSVWNAQSIPEGTLTVTKFKLPMDAHETLAHWARERTNRTTNQPVSVILQGLSEIMAWYVPEVAFVRDEWDREAQRRLLCLYFVGDVAQSHDLYNAVQTALAVWLGILYPEKSRDVRTAIAATALAPASWSRLDVGTRLKQHPGACAAPEDGTMWDALAAHAVAALAGEPLRFRSGETRTLVAKTAQSSAYDGIELVAFPPKHSPNSNGLWSEVVTVYTASYPERNALHVLARASIRNWGSVTRWSGDSDPNRSLDVFFPVNGEIETNGHKHTSFMYKPKEDRSARPDANGRRPLVARWRHKDEERIFSLIRRLTGNQAVETADLTAPIVNQDGLWVLPRLGTVHKDDRMAGGSGLPWPDRKDIAESLDGAFARVGLERANPMTRIRGINMPLRGPFNPRKPDPEVDCPQRRKAVRNALKAASNDTGELKFYVFHVLERTPATVIEALRKYLGEPTETHRGRLRWPDGLAITVVSTPSGVLAEQLPWVELTEREMEGRTVNQQNMILKAKREESLENVTRQMAAHVENARSGNTSVACGILEMPATLKGNTWRDPFKIARRALARFSVLPQVVLDDTQRSGADEHESKCAAAVRDCFRMLGTLPVEGNEYGYAPAAMTIIQRSTDVVAGNRRAAHAFPLAARVRDGQLECAIPEESADPVWLPYCEAALHILSGDYGKFGRGRQDENLARFNTFFTAVLADIDQRGPALVSAQGETLAHKLRTLENGRLELDRLAIGNRTFTPEDLPNLRLVRVSPDAKKQPYYYHETDSHWASGLFSWDEAERTFYGLKAKPPSVSNRQHVAAHASRHEIVEEATNRLRNEVGRVSAQMDEICIVFMQGNDNAKRLAALAHRLRGVHAQYRYDTSLPFPLHELRLLGGV